MPGLGGHIVDHEPANDENDQTEIPLVFRELDLSHGGIGHQKSRKKRSGAHDDTQRDAQPLLTTVIDTGDESGKSHQPLVGNPYTVGDELIEPRGGVFEGLGIIPETENGDVPHTGENAAEGPHSGKHPSDPDGPDKGDDRVDLQPARNAQVSGRPIRIDLAFSGSHGRTRNGILKFVRVCDPIQKDR